MTRSGATGTAGEAMSVEAESAGPTAGSDELQAAEVTRSGATGTAGEDTMSVEAESAGPTAGSDELLVASRERYEVLGQLGRGAMGEVYEARDRLLGRHVAIKFLRGDDPGRALRLVREVQAQARIEHPHVCKVYDAGEVNGKAYIAMQLVRGFPLDQAASELSLSEKLQVMIEVSEAVHEGNVLGVVHRDLKPSNILLERTSDGRWLPRVTDFGLAYDAESGHRLTNTGALMGTPSYMAPEQARGAIHDVDGRSDVYSLGATLYELVAGAPPFTGASVASVIDQVLHKDPPPLPSRAPDVPADLVTAILKCLSKEPEQRYQSARALADDLGRIRAGEPILGRRPGLVARLRRRARRQPALFAVSLGSAVLIAVLVAFGLRAWLDAYHAEAHAEKRADVAQKLGQEVKEIEWFLRAAYTLPLHNTTRAHEQVRTRLGKITADSHELGRAGEGLVHYALARGHLALRDFERSLAELDRASSLGIDSPELHYARGRVLGELYSRELENARLSGGHDWVVVRKGEIESRYLTPALAELEMSRGLEVESPSYLQGLIAFYKGQTAAALEAAARAAREAPWAYEAHVLAGDVAHTDALDQLGRGAYDSARARLNDAIGHYRKAAEVGRSDSRVYQALGVAWIDQSEIDERQGRPQDEALARAREASRDALVAAPSSATGYAVRARALMRWYLVISSRGDGDSSAVLQEWLAAATRAIELDPRNVVAYDSLGNARLLRGLSEVRQGRDPNRDWDEAIARLTTALQLQPNYPWALNDLAVVYRWKAHHLAQHGQDPRPTYTEAVRRLEQAIRSDPKYLFAYGNLGAVHNDLSEYDMSRGIDPSLEVAKGTEVCAQAISLDSQYWVALNQLAVAQLMMARYLLDSGGDPRPSIERAVEYFDRSAQGNPADGETAVGRGRAHHLAALHALRIGSDPGAALTAGRAALRMARSAQADCVECRVLAARLELVEAAWARRKGRAAQPALRRALAESRAAVATYRYNESLVELGRAAWRMAEDVPGHLARELVDEGLRAVDGALALAPHFAEAYAVRGGLLATRARTRADATIRQAARASLDRAFELNPLLQREYAEVQREVERRAR